MFRDIKTIKFAVYHISYFKHENDKQEHKKYADDIVMLILLINQLCNFIEKQFVLMELTKITILSKVKKYKSKYSMQEKCDVQGQSIFVCVLV